MEVFLNTNGNTQINSMTIQRVPLVKSSMMALNIASGFTVTEKMNTSEYDKLFHLRLLIRLSDNKYIYLMGARRSCVQLKVPCQIRLINFIQSMIQQSLKQLPCAMENNSSLQ